MALILKLYDALGPWFWVFLSGLGTAVIFGWFVGLGKKAAEGFAEEFGKVFGKSAAEWISDRSAPFKVRYLAYLSDLVRHVDLKGFAQDSPFALELLDVFVDLSLDPQSLRKISGGAIRPLPEALTTGRHSIWEYLQQPGQRLAIIGAPGSGKTTLLKHMILMGCAVKKRHAQKVSRSLPIFIEIRKQAKAIGEKADYGLVDAVLDQLGAFGKNASKHWFDSKLKRGGCQILIDGLDEVADPQLRQTVVNWVEKQIAAYPGNRCVVTSRPNGYRNNPIQGFNTLEVQSFAPEDIRRFVHAWYLATEVAHHRENTPAIRAKAKEDAGGLLGKLRQSADLIDLASNPLLLTMIATVHRYRGSLPGSRVELYGEIASVFLGRRRQARELDFDLRPDQKQGVLEPLAYEMMLLRIKEIPLENACSLVAKPLESVRPNTSADDFLREIESTSGLFVERENGIWGFAHLTVQEYLAAVHIRSRGLGDSVAQHVHVPWWHETVRLYVAQADATTIIEACLTGASFVTESLVLAIQCLEEARTIEVQSRRRFQGLISNSMASQDPEVRRPIAEALLHLRLAKMEALDENRLVSDYISNVEYQLFLDESRDRGVFRQPDRWTSYQFPAGTGYHAAAGVRASDATAFAEWLSARAHGDIHFRIPRREDGIMPSAIENVTDNPGFWSVIGDQLQIANTPFQARTEVLRALAEISIDRDVHMLHHAGLAADLGLNLSHGCAPDSPVLVPSNPSTNGLFSTESGFTELTSLDFDRVLDCARDLASRHDLLVIRSNAFDLDFSHARAQEKGRHPSSNDVPGPAQALFHAIMLLADRTRESIEINNFDTVLVVLARYCRSVALNIAHRRFRQLQVGGDTSFLSRVFQSTNTMGQPAKDLDFSSGFDIYWACTCDQLRRQGRIPSLGGIRVVCEQIPRTHPKNQSIS